MPETTYNHFDYNAITFYDTPSYLNDIRVVVKGADDEGKVSKKEREREAKKEQKKLKKAEAPKKERKKERKGDAR